MPLFIDRHDQTGLTAEEVAAAHILDVATQEKYGVRYHTYWYEPEDGTVFCLAEGPNRRAVEEVHEEAHGAVASSIIEIDSVTPLNHFLGTLPQHPVGAPYTASAVRAILFTDMCDSVAQTQELGDDAHVEVLAIHNRIVRDGLASHDGREVKHTGDGIMAAFTSVSSAVTGAVDMQRAIHLHNGDAEVPLAVKIGISAGEPVTDDSGDLFGAAVQLAARLCAHADPGEIVASIAVRELCAGKRLRFDTRDALLLKGIEEPTTAYTVAWRE